MKIFFWSQLVFSIHNRQRGQVVNSDVNVINTITDQNLLASFCCVFRKDPLGYFTLLVVFDKQF